MADKALLEEYRQRIKEELGGDAFLQTYLEAAEVRLDAGPAGGGDDKAMGGIVSKPRPGPRSRPHSEMFSKYAIFVLGPSAAGKTYMTRTTLLRQVLEMNKWPHDLTFSTIDGGLMREVSQLWLEMRDLAPHLEQRHAGFGDLFGWFKPHFSKVKKRLIERLIADGQHLIIPETAVDAAGTFAAASGKVRRPRTPHPSFSAGGVAWRRRGNAWQ